LSEGCFRKSFPNLVANYRYWPKQLNRRDRDGSVSIKFDLKDVKDAVKEHPLASKFEVDDIDCLWIWSAIPSNDKEIWLQLPPESGNWDKDVIANFFLAILKREHFLYNNAYKFIEGEGNAL
jgi:hypothetical protein